MDLKVTPWLIASLAAYSLILPLQGLCQDAVPPDSTATPPADSTAAAPADAMSAPPAADASTPPADASTPPVAAASTTPSAADSLPPDESSLSYTEGPYVAAMGTFLKSIKPDFGNNNGGTEKSKLDRGYGGTVVGGYRKKYFAMELGGMYTYNEGPSEIGLVLHGLVFPLAGSNGLLSGVYATVGGGLMEVRAYPDIGGAPYQGGKSYSFATYDAGVGDQYNMRIGNFKFALRGEARYRYGERKRLLDQAAVDYDAPRQYHDVLFNLGVQIPLVFKHDEAVLPQAPPAVVPVADSDGDGVIDSLDQCPDTPKGTQVDEKGCPLPAKPVCKTPAPGERITLDGCGAGDVIVLNGVNFEFNKSKLTVNAKTILDNVSEELASHPDVRVELSGHTDSRGTESYNQKLSESRAKAVLAYLRGKGIDASRMTAVGYGESRPIASNDTDEGRESNRRVEMKIVEGGSVTGTPVLDSSGGTVTTAPDAGGSSAPEAP